MSTKTEAKTSSRGITLRRDIRKPGNNENYHQVEEKFYWDKIEKTI